MMKRIASLVATGCLVVNSGQATPPPPVAETSPAAVASPILDLGPLNLSGKSIYVYNFLDRTDDEFDVKVIDEFERQIKDWLGAKSKGVTILRSEQTPLMKELRSTARDDWATTTSGASTTQRVPVLEAIASNRESERAFGADYRLVIFPSNFETRGAWRFYTLRWVVFRVADEKSWEYYYSGGHMVMWSNGERARSRAKKFIEAVNTAMQAANLFDK